MAVASSSSSSSPHPRNRYDVFLSFRGVETRYNFTSHLYEALCQKNIETFIDDQLNRGDEVSKSLLNAIEASSISLIIISEGYASSRWCLDELVKILECKNQYAQIVIPIFYGVDPSHVRKQTGTFGDLFSKLKVGPDKMQTWRDALIEAADLSGFHSHNTRHESELIKEVVNHIMKRLAEVFPRDNKGHLVGVESTVRKIESLLALGSGAKDAYTLGIWGIGGIGKTTIARAIFEKISNNFEGSCFLQNVREESERPGGLSCLQQKLVSQLLKDENYLIFRRFIRKKVLIVLDDVTCFNQIESLIGSSDWFMPQSRIIITTRNKQVLRNWGVKTIYEVHALEYHHALELFSRHAFKQNHPDIGYGEQSNKVVKYAKGVPLALKVLGCFLFEREKEVWESAINKLEKILNQDIQEVLKISYDGLDDKEKNIFLDIACFFKGADVYPTMKFLDESGFYAEIGISVLVDKSLIIISDNNEITMHDLLQEMGKEIVRQESVNDPRKRSRLWDQEDIINVLTSNTGTEAIEGICLDMCKVNKEIRLNPDTFSKMCKLRFLKLYSSIKNGENKCKVSYFQGPGLTEVKYLHWHGYPLKSLPSNIHLEKLVSLEMPHSNIEQLWNGAQQNGNLNQIIMAACKKLFNKIPNPSLTQHPNKLVTLNLSGCKSLKSIPAITHLEFLKELNLSDCSKLKRLPEISSGNIERMILNGTAIVELPSSIECLSSLLDLHLINCTSLESLPRNLGKLKSLMYLYLDGCSNLQRLPDEIGNLEALRGLYAVESGIGEVPSSIFRLKELRELYFNKRSPLSLPISLSLDGLHSITELNLTGCGITELPERLGQLSSLENLYLSHNNFERIPEIIIQLPKLKVLYLSFCERLQSFPKLPRNLYLLNLHHCTALESVPTLFSSNKYSHYQWYHLSDNFKLDGNELKRIVEDALQKFQLMATARWKQVREEVNYKPVDGHVILPGYEIPKWFTYQSMGSSVSLKMPPSVGLFNNNKVIGFAFSAIVAFQDYHASNSRSNVYCQFKFEPKDDLHDSQDFQRCIMRIDRVKSDHIILGYYFIDERDFNDFWKCLPHVFHLYFEEPCGSWPVKKCGIHLFYAQDFKLKTQGNEEEDSYPRRLK